MNTTVSDTTTEAFRLAMRRFAATVSIISTTTEDGACHGMAATAVTSLSMDPLSVLIAVNSSASLHGPLSEIGSFCVNVLHATQRKQCEVFSSKKDREKRFDTGNWDIKSAKSPFLIDAQANIFCTVERMVDCGSHTAFIGLVDEVRVDKSVAPLIYLDGGFLKETEAAFRLPHGVGAHGNDAKGNARQLEGIEWL